MSAFMPSTRSWPGTSWLRPSHVASLQYGQGDDVETVSEADFESAVERLRAEHARLAADPQAVARTYYEFNGQPVLIAQQVGRTPFAYIVLSDTGELAWSSHHLLAIVFKHDPAAHEISRADYEQRVAKVRAARKAGVAGVATTIAPLRSEALSPLQVWIALQYLGVLSGAEAPPEDIETNPEAVTEAGADLVRRGLLVVGPGRDGARQPHVGVVPATGRHPALCGPGRTRMRSRAGPRADRPPSAGRPTV